MINYLTKIDSVAEVKEELLISDNDVPQLSMDKINALAEIIVVLAEVHRVAQQFEADPVSYTHLTLPTILLV